MKKTLVAMIIISILTLVSCNREIIKKQTNSTGATIKETNESIVLPGNSVNKIKTYEGEAYKKVQYGKLSFSVGSYHIVSDSNNGNFVTIKCKIDKGEGYSWTKDFMNITVRTIEKQDFLDEKSILSYSRGMYPNYDEIKIYNNLTDNSGIVSLCIVSEGDQTKYVICYKDAYYLIESDVDEIYVLKKYPSEYYEMLNQKIECANSNITNVNETIYYNKNEFEKAEYIISQGKGGIRYYAELSRDEEYQYHFTLKNEKDKKLLTLSTYGQFDEVIKILDINMDGYADIQFLKAPGAMNNSYDLYVWDDSAKDFTKVNCKEMISYFEVHNGYLQNWVKNNAQSGVIQKLVWKNKNTLIKVSEETYHTN